MRVRSRIICVMALAAGLALAMSPVLAHHTFSVEYDSKKTITLKGQVVKVDWRNPHTYIYIETRDAKGRIVNWALEGPAPATNIRSGWHKDTLHKGDVIKVTGHPARDGSNRAAARKVTFSDGETMLLAPASR